MSYFLSSDFKNRSAKFEKNLTHQFTLQKNLILAYITYVFHTLEFRFTTRKQIFRKDL